MPASTALEEVLPIALVERDGEPRGHDLELAQRLKFRRPRAIRQLIERNLPELRSLGAIATQRGAYRGKEFDEYWLNEEQALLVAVLSDAENAPAVRAMLIRVFVAWRRGHLVPTEGLDARDTGGIVKKVLNKHSREVLLPGFDQRLDALAHLVAELLRKEAHPLAASHVPMRAILDHLQIPTRHRKALQSAVQYRASTSLIGRIQKCPLRNVLLYPRVETEDFVRYGCADLIRAHHDRLNPQGLLDLRLPRDSGPPH